MFSDNMPKGWKPHNSTKVEPMTLDRYIRTLPKDDVRYVEYLAMKDELLRLRRRGCHNCGGRKD